MSRIMDLILGLLKWPVAILAVISLPALIKALPLFNIANIRFYTFIIGAFAYFALKIFASARSNISMQILAHEFTHIFFALLTFHKVVHIHLNMDESGGAMGFKGKGNWLITISPYFFPLFIFILMLLVTFYSQKIPEGYWINGFLGYFFAYHIGSMLSQIHSKQPDFKEVGFPFVFLFLPGANIFACSLILAFNNGGWIGMQKYMTILHKLNLQTIADLSQYITS